MGKTSRAVSAQYPQPCPSCKAGPYQPCQSQQTKRVTDTHLPRLDAPAVVYVPDNDEVYAPTDEPNTEGYWKAAKDCDETCHHPVHAFCPERSRHLEHEDVIRQEGVQVPLEVLPRYREALGAVADRIAALG